MDRPTATVKFSGLLDTRTARTASGQRFPSVDMLYGPYDSKQEAWTALSTPNASGITALVIGKTVGIKENGSIVEYWFESACASINDLVKKNVSVAIDTVEDDLTIEDGTMRLADRSNANGLGYVILRTDKTFAQQVTKTNTIYEIRHEFSISGSFAMPSGCTLSFNGGHLVGLNSAVLVGNNTRIEGQFDTLKSVMSGIALNGTFANEQTAFSWWGAYKNDNTKDVHNGNILKYLLANKGDITFDGTFYIRFGETVNVSRPITFTDGEIYWTDPLVQYPSEFMKPAEGFSFYARNVVFHNSGNTRGFIWHDAADFIIDNLEFEGCSFLGLYRAVVITFAEKELTYTIGIRNFSLINCIVKNTSQCFHIDDGQFIDTLSILGNDFREFTGAPIYFASTNSKQYATERIKSSCVANIRNNTFVCTTPCTSSTPYHCAVLLELNVVNFENNHIEGIASTMNVVDGNEVGCHTCYDAYLSCKNIFYRNNTIRNVMGWRLDGHEKDLSTYQYPRTEIFKSKGAVRSVYTGNLFEIDSAWLTENSVPTDNNWLNIFRYETEQENVIFENNTINIPLTELRGRANNYAPIVNMTFNNNTVIAKKITNMITNGGKTKDDLDNDIPLNSLTINNNTFKATDAPINILYIKDPSGKSTAINSIAVKNNQSNQVMGMTNATLTSPSIGYFEWDNNTDDFDSSSKGLYYYTGDAVNKMSVRGNAENKSVNLYVNSVANTSAEFAFANILNKFYLFEALTGTTGETKSYTVTVEVVKDGIPLKAECTVQRVEVDTDVYEVQWYAKWQTLSSGTITNNEFYGKVGDVAKNVLRGSKFYGVIMNVDSEKFVVNKYSQDMRDDYTDIKYSLRNNGNSRTFVYDSTKDGSTIDPFPLAFPDMNFEGSYGRSIKFITDHVEYKQVTNATSVQFLLTQYAVENLDTNEEGWWSCVISSDSHYYMRIVSENNCGSSIEDVELEIRYRKGIEAYSGTIRISIPSGSDDQVVDIAELLIDAEPASYQLITHFTVYGIYSATAEADDTIDITVNVYEVSTTNPE